MARQSVIPAVKERLELYLDERHAEYLEQPDGSRTATLPKTPDGKVNVRGIATAIGLRQTQEKYLFEREELSSLINLVAEGQELLSIGPLPRQSGCTSWKWPTTTRWARSSGLGKSWRT